MSIDGVDDLHAAEDHGETLRLASRRVAEAWEAMRTTGSVEALSDAIIDLDSASEDPRRITLVDIATGKYLTDPTS